MKPRFDCSFALEPSSLKAFPAVIVFFLGSHELNSLEETLFKQVSASAGTRSFTVTEADSG